MHPCLLAATADLPQYSLLPKIWWGEILIFIQWSLNLIRPRLGFSKRALKDMSSKIILKYNEHTDMQGTQSYGDVDLQLQSESRACLW